MACWYTRREFALRVALLYSGLVLAQAFSGLIAAGVFAGLDGPRGLAGWQWLFILEGAMSGFFAITAYFILPNYPTSEGGGAMWYMTADMRRVAHARILDDRVEVTGKATVWHGLKLALKDIKLYMFLFMNLFITSSYGFNNFFPTIVNGLGVCPTPPSCPD
jgi:sugar phosphate permease